jgi:hypothetical protein
MLFAPRCRRCFPRRQFFPNRAWLYPPKRDAVEEKPDDDLPFRIKLEKRRTYRKKKMNITRANYLKGPQRGVRIIADGQPAIIKPVKKTLLDRGIAVLADTEDAPFPWVNNLGYHLNGDVTDLRPETRIVGGTDDPVAVCLARRYWRASREGKAKPGRVGVPALEEAKCELNDPGSWPKT